MQCTQVQSVEELVVSLESMTMWEELGQQLKLSQTLLNQIQKDSLPVDVKEKTKNVARY